MPETTERVAKLPLVTIVVISYNHGRYLDICLRGILEQTYGRIQCIVVDNASQDNSKDVIASYEPRFREAAGERTFQPILETTNSHLTGAMFRGFAEAKGAYVIFCDGDDVLLPACVEAHVKTHLVTRIAVGATSVDMFQSRGEDLVTGSGQTFQRYVMSGKGQVKSFCRMENLDAFDFSGFEKLQLKEKDLHFVDRSMTREWVWSPTSGQCFRREAVELMFSHRPNIGAGTDNYLMRGISSITGSITIDLPLGIYRMHETNMFTKHPALSNLVQFDKAQLGASDEEVSLEMIECFRKQAASLASRLEDPETYIDAIDAFTKVGPGLKVPDESSNYTLHFLRANAGVLTQAFGESRYKSWLRRFTMVWDRMGLLKKK